jgi:DNA-binding transcriptional ArsR family regulator
VSGRGTARGLRELDDIDAVFAALAHPSRRHVLQVLHAHDGRLTAGQLAARFAHTWPTTTRHLNGLTAAGLVTVSKVGRERHYSLNRDKLAGVLDLWLASLSLGIVDKAFGTEAGTATAVPRSKERTQ